MLLNAFNKYNKLELDITNRTRFSVYGRPSVTSQPLRHNNRRTKKKKTKGESLYTKKANKKKSKFVVLLGKKKKKE